MGTTSGASAVRLFEALLADSRCARNPLGNELASLPDPARRYFGASIASGAPLTRSARFAMRESIKLGSRRLPIRGPEVLSPHGDWCGPFRTGAVISGSDRY